MSHTITQHKRKRRIKRKISVEESSREVANDLMFFLKKEFKNLTQEKKL